MLQLLIFTPEQESMLLEHFHGRRHTQRKAVVFDDHGATYRYCFYIRSKSSEFRNFTILKAWQSH